MTSLVPRSLVRGSSAPFMWKAFARAGVRVAGVLGSSEVKSRQCAERLGLPCAYHSYEEVLGDPAVDVVHLATPNRVHFGQACASAARRQARPLREAAGHDVDRDGGAGPPRPGNARVAGVCYNVRFYPLCLEAAERARHGTLGEVYHVTGSYVQDWLFHDTDFNWRVLADEGGALRAVADIGTHWLDLVQFITGLQIVERVAPICGPSCPMRQRPRGAVETFSSKLRPPRQRNRCPSTPRTTAASCCGFAAGPAGASGCRR